MSWQDKTITLGELARLIREERMPENLPGYPGSFNNGLDCIAIQIASNVGLSDDDSLAFTDDATVVR